MEEVGGQHRGAIVSDSVPKLPEALKLPHGEPTASQGSITLLIGQLRGGSGEATEKLWSRYFPRLRGLARKTLSGHPQRVADADDAAQSAFLSFWRQAERGQLDPEMHRDNLWSLLATITVRKALKQVKREQALKRGGGRVLGEGSLAIRGDDTPRALETIVGELPTGDFDLQCEELLEMLDPDLRIFAVLRLVGQTNGEIAQRMGCTERKVERKLNLIRLRWEHEVAE